MCENVFYHFKFVILFRKTSGTNVFLGLYSFNKNNFSLIFQGIIDFFFKQKSGTGSEQ